MYRLFVIFMFIMLPEVPKRSVGYSETQFKVVTLADACYDPNRYVLKIHNHQDEPAYIKDKYQTTYIGNTRANPALIGLHLVKLPVGSDAVIVDVNDNEMDWTLIEYHHVGANDD